AAGPQAIHEQVVRLVVEADATGVVDVRPVYKGPVAEAEPAETESAEEERIVVRAIERHGGDRIVEERIVAGAEAVTIGEAVAVARRVIRRVVVVVRRLSRDD